MSYPSRFQIAALVAVSGLLISYFTSAYATDQPVADSAEAAPGVPTEISRFVKANCLDCHHGKLSEGGLDLLQLVALPDATDQMDRWVHVFDRVHAGEMPPPDATAIDPGAQSAFLKHTSDWIRNVQLRQQAAAGRVHARRLTKLQLERTLHDLLGIDIPLATELPDEPRTDGFTNVADGQSISHFQLEQHLRVVDLALDEAVRRATSAPDERSFSMTPRDIVRRDPRRRCREPEMFGGKAVVWSGGLIFYGRVPATTARESGWYRFTIEATALKKPQDRGVWCTVRSGPCVSSAPMLAWAGAFEATEEPQKWIFETWLPRGHMLEIRPGDVTLPRARFEGGQVGAGEGEPQNVPGIAIHSLEMERIHHGPGNAHVRRALYGDVEVQQRREQWQLISESPQQDAAELVTHFAQRAFRRPITKEIAAPYIRMVHDLLNEGEPLADALRGTYRAVLCSPHFMYFHEEPGALDGYAVANRLSYFLWNTMPDECLMAAAANGELLSEVNLRQHVERMLEDPRGQDFVRDFAAEWLDLSLIDFTEPDRRLYPDFDVIVQQSMLDEVHAYLQNMVRDNADVRKIIASDSTWLNSRLARFYNIPGVEGDRLQEVSLSPENHRGGLLTMGAILKVTANGTTTSPVIRGVWISERLLGQPIPPPPGGVPAIEPDIRGASSIRDLLAKHRSDDSCASCHVKIDPPGFALENYDPSGKWRLSYGSSRGKGPNIDASYDLPDGRHFDDVDGFRELIAADAAQLARNVAEKMLTYGTGAAMTFADRAAVDEIVEKAEPHDYGFRTLIHEVVASEVFRSK